MRCSYFNFSPGLADHLTNRLEPVAHAGARPNDNPFDAIENVEGRKWCLRVSDTITLIRTSCGVVREPFPHPTPVRS